MNYSTVPLSDAYNIVVENVAMVVSLGQTGSELAGGSRAAAMSLLREAIEMLEIILKTKTIMFEAADVTIHYRGMILRL